MIAYIFLKRLEVLAATRRVAFAVAENRVHSLRGFDGEIAQVRFQRAVEVARKKQPGVVVDDDPPREVDRIDLLDRAFGIGLQTGEDLAQSRRAALFQRRDDGELCDDARRFC